MTLPGKLRRVYRRLSMEQENKMLSKAKSASSGSKVKIRFVFHKGKDSFVGRSIVLWTWMLGLFYNWKVLKYNYSHVEVWLPETECPHGFEWRYLSKPQGQCFSSTTRGTYNGVRFDAAQNVLGKHPERWDYIECEVDAERLEVAVEEAKKLVGGGYDYGYVISFLQPFIVQKDGDWACSEIINWFAVLCRLAKQFLRISPRKFAYNLAKTWGEPKPIC